MKTLLLTLALILIPTLANGQQTDQERAYEARADALDAMTSDRPYRNLFKWEEVEEELAANSGTQFDPKMIVAAIELAKSGRLFPARHPSRPPEVGKENTLGRATSKALRKSRTLLGKLNLTP